MSRGVSYRSMNSVAVEVRLINSGTEPWSAEGASLVSTTGKRLEGVRVGQVGPIPPQEAGECSSKQTQRAEFHAER